jgi:hypothetical protein
MRKTFGAALVMLLMSACSTSGAAVSGTGSAGQRSFDVGAFNSVDLAGPYNVVVTVGGAPSVRAEGDEEALERMEVRLEDGHLVIGTRRGTWGPMQGNATVYVTAPALESAAVAGSGDMRVGAFRAASFDANIAGSGNLLLEGLETDAASFDVAGSGNVQASGRTQQTRISIAGSGHTRLGAFESASADITVAGSGGAELRATGTAAVSIVGSGDVAITGGARCTVSRVGSGDVSCG